MTDSFTRPLIALTLFLLNRSFLLVYGLNGILGLMLADTKTIEEMEKMASGAAMMQQ